MDERGPWGWWTHEAWCALTRLLLFILSAAAPRGTQGYDTDGGEIWRCGRFGAAPIARCTLDPGVSVSESPSGSSPAPSVLWTSTASFLYVFVRRQKLSFSFSRNTRSRGRTHGRAEYLIAQIVRHRHLATHTHKYLSYFLHHWSDLIQNLTAIDHIILIIRLSNHIFTF